MLESIGSFIKALIESTPKLYDLYLKGKKEEKIIELFECYYLFRDLIDTADKLLSIARDKNSITFDQLNEEELNKHYSNVQSHLTIQLQRLDRIGKIFLNNPTIDLLEPNLKNKVQKTIGGKEDGIYSIGAALFFNQMFGNAQHQDEPKQDWLQRVVSEKYDFAYGIVTDKEISLSEQKEIVSELKKLRDQYLECINNVVTAEHKLLLANKSQELAAEYSLRA